MNTHILTKIALCIFLLQCLIVQGQTIGQIDPTPKLPQTSVISPVNVNNYNSQANINATNQSIINQTNTRNQRQLSQYEKDRKKLELERQQLKKIYKEQDEHKTINYELPSWSKISGTEHYYNALSSLLTMNPDDFSIKDATFIIENAFYGNTQSYEQYNKIITNTADFIRQAMKQQKLDPNSNLSKNLTIYQFISDTLTVNEKTHTPFKYDFNDYMGRKNWDNMFVHKLMLNGTGQCNSMPRYYQILAEELETETYLAFAPNHSFIRFKNKLGDWYNAELTSGAIMSDYLMLNSGFIKSETVTNGNYLTAQTNRQVMAQLLNDLASGYISKYGYDEFVGQIINRSLELNPNGINGNLHKFNYKLEKVTFVARQLQAKTPEELAPYPKATALLNELSQLDRNLKNLGFEETPKEQYEAWLKTLEEQKKKQDKERLLNQFKIQTPIKN